MRQLTETAHHRIRRGPGKVRGLMRPIGEAA